MVNLDKIFWAQHRKGKGQRINLFCFRPGWKKNSTSVLDRRRATFKGPERMLPEAGDKAAGTTLGNS